MHYYNRDGSPCYEIKGKNGKMRTPYIREAKQLNLAPGVTSITGLLHKEAITTWSIQTAVNTCMRNPYCAMGCIEEKWIANIKQLIKQEQERISNQGKEIHDALEQFYRKGIIKPRYKEFIIPVIELIDNKWPMLKRTDWVAEKSFNYKGWYGGKIDLHTEYNQGIILDFKTKDTTDIIKFIPYEEHKQQLIAYAYGIDKPNAVCGNIFLSALQPGIIKEEFYENLDIYWMKFKLLVQYWHLNNFGINIGAVKL